MGLDLSESISPSFNRCNTNKGGKLFDLKYKSAEKDGSSWDGMGVYGSGFD